MKTSEGRVREREWSLTALWGLRNGGAHSDPVLCSCQADPTVSWAGRHLHGPPCPKEASPVSLQPLRTHRMRLCIWTLIVGGYG